MGKRDEKYSLSGVIELDEGFFSTETPDQDKDKPLKRSRGSQKESKVLVMAESQNVDCETTKSDKPRQVGHIKMIVINDLKSETITSLVKENVTEQSTIDSDNSTSYVKLKDIVKEHRSQVINVNLMKKNNLFGFFIILFILTVRGFIGQANTNYLKFDHLTVDNGLSSNRIWCILRDSKDYLWLGTDVGLDKYDSYQVKKYRYDEKKPGTISSNNLICIYEDREKNIWCGTTNGLNLYDPTKDNFKVYQYNPDDKTSINSNNVNSITEDKKGNLWIVTDGNCLNKWESKTQTFARYQFENKDVALYARPCRMISTDSKGYLWVVSLGRGIYRFDPESGEFTKYDDPTIDFGDDCLKNIYIDNQDKIWIGADGSGFFSYDPVANKFEQFGFKGDGKGTNQKLILDIMPENERYLLLAVDQGGINRFDKITRTFEYIMSDQTNDNGLNNNGIWCFHKDKEGILWIGTSGGGINYSNPKKEKFKLFTHQPNNPKSLSYNFTGCFCEDHQGFIWIGTDGGGVNIYDPKTGNFTVYKHNPSDPFSISGNVIRCIAEDRDHDIWVGTWDAGLNRFDRKTGKFYRYLPEKNNPSSISTRTIWNLKIDHNDNIWLANYGVGVDILNKNEGVIKRFRKSRGNQDSISSNQAFLFFEDSKKNMWVCTENGLDLYNSQFQLIKVYHFPDNIIGAFYQGADGNLWVGSNTKGLFYCKPDGTIIKTFDTNNGLPNNRIQGILEDKHGFLWISTSGGISQLDPKTGKIRSYSKEDGLQGDQFFQQSFMKTIGGKMYFGGYNGFNAFDPDNLKDNDFIPPVYITDFQIFNKPVTFAVPGAQFPTYISEAKKITLNWNQSVFSFSFAAINYTNSEKNQYSYLMEGFEKEWNSTTSLRRYITYTNLDPGHYILHIKASNNDGVWNNKGVSLKIDILPPWWKTLWVKLFGAIALILILVLAYYLRLEIYRKREKELSELVDKRTTEITSANHELVDRQTLIERQSEELVKLNSTKDRIFSIIAHDLRNPFNVVSGFSEILLEDYHNLPPDKIEMYLNLISNSSKNGNVLLENLLQWSRAQTGRISFEPVQLNFFLLAEETSNFSIGEAIKKNISILLQIDPDLYVNADANMLKTIMRNLLSNSVKFTPKNGIVTVTSSIKSEFVEVIVSDSGVGIPEEKIPLLFKIESNRSTKGTSQETGTGLGLILCKEFVDKHHGKIWVESKVDAGTQFKFTLPLA